MGQELHLLNLNYEGSWYRSLPSGPRAHLPTSNYSRSEYVPREHVRRRSLDLHLLISLVQSAHLSRASRRWPAWLFASNHSP